MTIDAVSQSTGAERVVDIEADGAGVRLVIREKSVERARAVVPADALMDILSERPAGPQTVSGDHPVVIEVRRNEVLLAVGGSDAAVGLDDFMDALAGVLPLS